MGGDEVSDISAGAGEEVGGMVNGTGLILGSIARSEASGGQRLVSTMSWRRLGGLLTHGPDDTLFLIKCCSIPLPFLFVSCLSRFSLLYYANTECGKTKVTKISAVLFCKVFIATKCLFILYNSLAYCI